MHARARLRGITLAPNDPQLRGAKLAFWADNALGYSEPQIDAGAPMQVLAEDLWDGARSPTYSKFASRLVLTQKHQNW